MGQQLRHRIRVRYSECDQQGVVFNAHYLGWFDNSMTELFRAGFGSYGEFVKRGLDIVVVHAELDFRRPARFDDEVELAVMVERIGESSLRCRHEVWRESELLVEGQTMHVFVDAEVMTKCSAPSWVREGLEPWTRAGAPPASGKPALER
jgi:acyl-CoA thioester hydrolase